MEQGFKNSVAEKGLPGCDGLDLPDKVGGCFALAELFHALNKGALVRLGGRGKEVAMCRGQCRIDGRVQSDGITRKGSMQQPEKLCLKRQTPCTPGDDAKAPEKLIVPVQGS